ncbi:uncharacterized protein LOC129573985 isoform X2 [Sitodiplosis mosellana]|uniref:uncharacterized protein LOC129573985 isoform X2 n=1 Tax=Sitodiplosis mosellana TaxID=263140 RepID=UPI0024451BAD|nr:uncharacterized protein LOC129573985 isoform X2 [Sitodiplosis mosellana]
MSTSTLGGFEREERKILYDEYLFQRRVLFGITISIIFAAFIWTIAICTDHWILVAGDKPIFIPISERFFLSSHTGLWRLCRYALAPILLTNSTLPQLLTKLIVTDGNEINRLKNDIANQPFIKEWYNLSVPITNVTSIDNRFKQALFAKWILDPKDFATIKTKYKTLANPLNTTAGGGGGKQKKVQHIQISSHNLTMVKELFGLTPINVQVNETRRATVFVPRNLQLALFDEWPQKEKVVSLLGQFAKDMDLSPIIKAPNGTQLILRPPDPPSKGQTNPDYRYAKYEICKYHNFFPLINETEYDPSIDEFLLDLVRTQASFACICLLIMTMAFVFSMYTFLNPRYMFKRLAAGVHFISASICFVVLRIVSYAVDYEKKHMDYLFPKGADYFYGYGVYMAWAVFIVNASACFLFLWYSKKRKGNKAPTEELAMADEPINMGR